MVFRFHNKFFANCFILVIIGFLSFDVDQNGPNPENNCYILMFMRFSIFVEATTISISK